MGLLFLLGIFDLIGAGMAFLISYDELSRHHPRGRAALLEATRRAFVSLVFLVALSAIIVVVVHRATP